MVIRFVYRFSDRETAPGGVVCTLFAVGAFPLCAVFADMLCTVFRTEFFLRRVRLVRLNSAFGGQARAKAGLGACLHDCSNLEQSAIAAGADPDHCFDLKQWSVALQFGLVAAFGRSVAGNAMAGLLPGSSIARGSVEPRQWVSALAGWPGQAPRRSRLAHALPTACFKHEPIATYQRVRSSAG